MTARPHTYGQINASPDRKYFGAGEARTRTKLVCGSESEDRRSTPEPRRIPVIDRLLFLNQGINVLALEVILPYLLTVQSGKAINWISSSPSQVSLDIQFKYFLVAHTFNCQKLQIQFFSMTSLTTINR